MSNISHGYFIFSQLKGEIAYCYRVPSFLHFPGSVISSINHEDYVETAIQFIRVYCGKEPYFVFKGQQYTSYELVFAIQGLYTIEQILDLDTLEEIFDFVYDLGEIL